MQSVPTEYLGCMPNGTQHSQKQIHRLAQDCVNHSVPDAGLRTVHDKFTHRGGRARDPQVTKCANGESDMALNATVREIERRVFSIELDTARSRGCVRGSMVRSHIDWVRHHRDREETIEFYEALQPEVRYACTRLGPSAWCPASVLVDIDRVVVDQFGNGDASFLENLGAYFAQIALDDIQVVRVAFEIHDRLRKIITILGQFEDFGTVALYTPTGLSAGTITRSSAIEFSPLLCASSIGYYRECIRLYGGAGINVVEKFCQSRGDSACGFEVAWK